MMLCRWRMLPNRCATLSFSRAFLSLSNRVIHPRISVSSPLFAVRFCVTALVDRLQHTGRCISQFSAPGFRRQALAVLYRAQAKWARLPLALPTVVLVLSPKRWLEDDWLVACYWNKDRRFICGSSRTAHGEELLHLVLRCKCQRFRF